MFTFYSSFPITKRQKKRPFERKPTRRNLKKDFSRAGSVSSRRQATAACYSLPGVFGRCAACAANADTPPEYRYIYN